MAAMNKRRPAPNTAIAFQHTTPEISPTEIQIGELIGEGSFGKVYKGKCRGKDVVRFSPRLVLALFSSARRPPALPRAFTRLLLAPPAR